MEEVSLKELLKAILKYKVLILGVIGVLLLFSVVYSFFILEPLYQAKATIMINSKDTGAVSFDRNNSAEDVADIYIGWMHDSQFLDKVSNRLQSHKINISANTLKSIISASKGRNGDTIIIVSKYKDKSVVAPIVNDLISVLNEEASTYTTVQIQQQIGVIDGKIAIVNGDSGKALSTYESQSSGKESFSKLQSELDVSKSLLVELKANIISGNIGQDKSIGQVREEITAIENQVDALQTKLVSAEYKDKLLRSELDSLLIISESLNEERDRLRIAEDYYKEKSSINILSSAVEPKSASEPNRPVIIMSALLIGLSVGVISAFTIEYLKVSK